MRSDLASTREYLLNLMAEITNRPAHFRRVVTTIQRLLWIIDNTLAEMDDAQED